MPAQKDFRVLMVSANTYMSTLIPPTIATLSAHIKTSGYQLRLFDTTFYKTTDLDGDEARYKTLQVKEANLADYGLTAVTTDMHDDFRKVVLDYKPHLIGVSAIEPTFRIGISLLECVKDLGIPTIMGGMFATANPYGVIQEDVVDMVCVGEGEEALIELCDRMYNGDDIYTIKNIWFKKNGSIVANDRRPPIDMAGLIFQDWEIFDKKRFFKPMGGKVRTTGCIELSRGCPFNCSYCCNETLNEIYNSRFYRERPVEHFIAECCEKKKQYKLEYVYISAEVFLNAKKDRFEKFVDMWPSVGIPFWIEARPESIDEDEIRQLSEIGCESISTGVESGNEELRRKLLKRKVTNDQIVEAFNILNKFPRIRSYANNIIGFPGETREQIFDTIELTRRAQPQNVMVNIFQPYRGTSLYDESIENNYMDEGVLAGDYRMDVALRNPHMTQEELLGIQRTFVLYVRMPESRYPEIERAEKFDREGNRIFEKLAREYKEKFFSTKHYELFE